jgi:hypothetical protein
MTAMLNNEFSRLIYVNSIERTEVERDLPYWMNQGGTQLS